MIEAGTVLQNRYQIQKQIGSGGMGTVYIATDSRFNSKVAIKETLFTDSTLRKAFEREAQLLNSLRHPALPRVSDHFEEGNGRFLVMEYIAGDDLSEILDRRGSFEIADVLKWADQLLDALDYLHTQKMPVVHRDIKPQNLKLTPRGDIVLLDFGLAKGKTGDQTQASQTKSVFGYSRAYAPLEQIQGTGTDPRSDIYSLGATIYHLLSGSAPNDALTRATAVLNNQPDPLRAVNRLNPKVSTAVSNVINQSMSLNASLRPQSAAAMRAALQEAAQGVGDVNDSAAANTVTGENVFKDNTQLNNDAGTSANFANNTGVNQATDVFDNENSNVISEAGSEFAGTWINQAGRQTAPNESLPEAAEFANARQAAGGAIRVPVNQPVNAPNFNSDVISTAGSPRRSLATPVGIIAAIAILGGGGYATWYATSGAKNAVNTNNQNVVSKPVAKHDESNSKQNTNANVAASPSPEASPLTATNPQPTHNEPQNPPSATETKQNEPQAPPVIERIEKRPVTVARPSDVPKDEQQTQSNDDEPPPPKNDEPEQSDEPPIPSNRPMNSEELEKLQIWTQKQQEAARQIRDETFRRLRERWLEENRRRAEQGLPPLPAPRRPRQQEQ